jgi:hypothetical protein
MKARNFLNIYMFFQEQTTRHAAIHIITIIAVFVMVGSMKYCKLHSNHGAMNPKSSWQLTSNLGVKNSKVQSAALITLLGDTEAPASCVQQVSKHGISRCHAEV